MQRYNLRTSPFLDFQSPFTAWEAVKMVILLPLVPVRLLLMLLAIGLIAIINSTATWGWPEGRPLSVARRSIVEAGSSLCRVIFFALGFHVTVSGWKNVQEAKRVKAIGVFNHVSYVDTLLLFWLFLPSGVSKRGNSRIPVIKHCIRCLNNIWVDDTKRVTPSVSPNADGKPSANSVDDAPGAVSLTEAISKKAGHADGAQVELERPSSPIQTHLTTDDADNVEDLMPAAFHDITNVPSRQGSVRERPKDAASSAVDRSNMGFSTDQSAQGADTSDAGVNADHQSNTDVNVDQESNTDVNGDRSKTGVHVDQRSNAPATTVGTDAAKAPDAKGQGLLAGHPLELNAPTSAKSVTALITERVLDPLYCAPGGFPLLFIAPEGTVTNGQCLIKFRSGAFIMGRPVLPVLLKYPFKCLNPAYTEMETPFHLLRLMCQWFNNLEVTILPPYIPSPEEVADPALYAANVRQLMADKLQVPLVDEEYAHCSAMRKKNIWVGWDGKKVVGPQQEIDEDLNIMLQVPVKKQM